MATSARSKSEAVRDLSQRAMALARHYQMRGRDRVCRHGITVGQCFALEAIVEHEGMLVTGVAAALGLDKSNASRVVDSLREAGLAKVDGVPKNRRAKRVVPTAKGRALAARIAAEIAEEHHKVFPGFTRTDIQACERVLVALLGAPPLSDH